MPVSKPDVVDVIGVNTLMNVVQLRMYEERDWWDTQTQVSELQRKINHYLSFVFGGELAETPEYRGKKIVVILHCQFQPPDEVNSVFHDLESQLHALNVLFEIYIGPDERQPLRWRVRRGTESNTDTQSEN